MGSFVVFDGNFQEVTLKIMATITECPADLVYFAPQEKFQQAGPNFPS